MADIFDALINESQPDPAALAASLRRKETMGVLGSMTGIEGLRKVGPSLQASADKGAQDYATLRDRTQSQALARAAALQAHLDSVNTAEERIDADANARREHDETLKAIANINADSRNNKEQDKTDLANEKKRDAATAALAAYDHMIEQAQDIRKSPYLSRISGPLGGIVLPGSAGTDIKRNLHSLTSGSALAALQALRAGGASLGRVTNMEMQILQNSVAPLEAEGMSLEGRQKALDEFLKYSKESRRRIAAAGGIELPDDTDLPADAGAGGPPIAPPGGTGPKSRLPKATSAFPSQVQPGDNPIESAGSQAYLRDRPGSSPPNNPADNAPALVRVRNRAEADALPPGTHFLTPDGREKIR